jgi:recombination protein RecT
MENTTTGVIKTPTPQASLMQMMQRMEKQVMMALPKHITPERMIRTFLTACNKNPKLFEAKQTTLIGALMECSQLGLMPDGTTGEAYLIPFKSQTGMECQLIIGYRGYITLARRSGDVKSIMSNVVYSTDKFEYEYGLEDKLSHVPSGKGGEATHVYAIIKFVNGGYQYIVLTKGEIDMVRDKSANYKYAARKEQTVWGMYWEEMAKKTAIRRLIKLVPLSAELNRALSLDEADDLGSSQKLWANVAANMDLPQSIVEDANHEVMNSSVSEEEIKADIKAQEVKIVAETKAQVGMENVLSKLVTASSTSVSGFLRTTPDLTTQK